MRNTRWIIPMTLLAAVCLGGCQSSHKPKEEAVRRWNAARASVLQGLAENQYKTGDFDQARKTLDQAIVLMPQSAKLRIWSARVALEQSRLELASQELQEARKLDPKNAEADYYSGIVFQRWRQSDAALGFYTDACEKDPAELGYFLARAEMLVSMNRSNEALALLQSKLAYFEHSAALCDAIGSIYMNQNDYAKAADQFAQASVFADDDQGIREHLALALYFSKQYRQATAVFKRLMTDPDEAKRSDLQRAMGECLMNDQQPREALSHLQAAAQIAGDQPAVWISLGRCQLQLDDAAQAEAALQRALNLNAASNEANLMMGYARLRQGKLSSALASFELAAQANPHDATSLCMVGYALQKLGRGVEARQWYDAALKQRPHDELASKLLAGVD